MKRVLIVSPHFPPDTGAASHRMRLLAPRLPEHGWEPTVIAVEPRDLGVRTESELEHFVHGSVRVERVRALGGEGGRFLGIGDLGLRTLRSMEQHCRRLLRDEPYETMLITLPPHYTAILGPRLHRVSRVPYVLDYQDPWVSAWGLSVGGGANGRPDLKSRLSRRLALLLEPRALADAAAVTAVSEGTLTDILQRHPHVSALPRAEVPLGGDPRDFLLARERPQPNRFFRPDDGFVHLVYVGTLLPLGVQVLATLFRGAALLRQSNPGRFARLRFHFFGTSNQTAGDVSPRALPLAREAGIEALVEEHPLRIGYVEALTVLTQAGAILLLGSTESHYTASKIYPALLAARPLLAVYHEASSACEALRRLGPGLGTFLVTFGGEAGLAAIPSAIAEALSALPDGAPSASADRIPDLGEWSASALAGRMAECLSAAAARNRERTPVHG